ncbi:MAG TPA: ACP S-malonyltransferase [Thermoanaerobaculia bacterium]|jgi:malonyl CoA-acyl carrier protein transacylase
MVIVFPGQGSQHAGMGRELFAKYPRQAEEASSILGYDLPALCIEDRERKLSRTEYTQPALFVVNALSYLDRGSPRPSHFAGHSLGEFNALWAGGAFDFATGVRLVRKRGELMARVRGGGMAAVIGLPPLQVRKVLASSAVDVANYNSYDQTVVSGLKEDIDAAIPLLERAEAKHVVPLDVSAPFHSRHMKETEVELAAFLETQPIALPHTPVVANATALPYEKDVRSTLLRQICGSVRWIESVEYLLRSGEKEFVEVGPGNVLTKLIRNIRERTPFAN